LAYNIDYVKVICDQIPPGSPEMNLKQLTALVLAAHQSNKKVFVHIGSPENAIDAIKAGADILAHGIWRGKLTPEQADFIADSKTPLIYTIAGFHNVSEIHKGSFCPHEIDSILVPENVLNPVTGQQGMEVHDQAVMNAFFADVAKQSEFFEENFKLLLNRNAPIHIGTDSNLPGTYAGTTYFQELDLLKQYGMSNFELLKAATYSNAHLFLDNPDFGEVAEGKKANLLILNGNPLTDLNFVKSPQFILKNGEFIKRLVPYTPNH
jgi:imidazolonepropionase-like amidohydrolase